MRRSDCIKIQNSAAERVSGTGRGCGRSRTLDAGVGRPTLHAGGRGKVLPLPPWAPRQRRAVGKSARLLMRGCAGDGSSGCSAVGCRPCRWRHRGDLASCPTSPMRATGDTAATWLAWICRSLRPLVQGRARQYQRTSAAAAAAPVGDTVSPAPASAGFGRVTTFSSWTSSGKTASARPAGAHQVRLGRSRCTPPKPLQGLAECGVVLVTAARAADPPDVAIGDIEATWPVARRRQCERLVTRPRPGWRGSVASLPPP